MLDQEDIREEDTFFGNAKYVDPFEPYYMPYNRIRSEPAGRYIAANDSGWILEHFIPQGIESLSADRKYLLQRFLDKNGVHITQSQEVEVLDEDHWRAGEALKCYAKEIIWIGALYPDSIVKKKVKEAIDEDAVLDPEIEWQYKVNRTFREKDIAKTYYVPDDQITMGFCGIGRAFASDGGYTFHHFVPEKYHGVYGQYDSRAYLLQHFLRQHHIQVFSGALEAYGVDGQSATWNLLSAIEHIIYITVLAPIEAVNKRAEELAKEENEEQIGKMAYKMMMNENA